MNEDFKYFYHNTSNKVIVDTNLLLLLLIGRVNPNLINKFKRTDEFTKKDYELLLIILNGHFEKIITSPNILTEVDNFIKNLKNLENKKLALYWISKFLIDEFVEEIYIKSNILFNEPCFLYFGITDTAITKISKENIGVVTKDGKLYQELIQQGVPALDFSKYMEKKPKLKY